MSLGGPEPRRSSRADHVAGAAAGALGGFLAIDLGLPALVSYWHDWTVFVVAGAILGALLRPTRLWPLAAAAIAGLALLWSVVAFSPLDRWLAEGLVRRDPVEPCDAVVVLTSRIQPDGDLTTTAMSRLLHALELLGQRQAPRLILSEVRPLKGSYAGAARRLMEHLAIDAEVHAVGPTGNTRDEAVLVGKLCRERGWKKLLLVTSLAHSRRASAAFEAEGLTIVSSPSPETEFDFESLDGPADRRDAFGALMHEWIGLSLYRWRGWLGEVSVTSPK